MSKPMEIEGPTIRCGACHYMSKLAGEWGIEQGRLVWRGDTILTPSRGPKLDICCEGRDCNLDGANPPGALLDGEPMSEDAYFTILWMQREAIRDGLA